MKNISLFFFTMLVLALFAGSGFAQQKGQTEPGNGYEPKVTYAGQYQGNVVFFRYSKKDFWRRRPSMDLLRNVRCQDALDHLTTEGKWRGRLDQYGSCESNSSEAPEWTVGNRLNYDELLQ
jgi:hypothetical protein